MSTDSFFEYLAFDFFDHSIFTRDLISLKIDFFGNQNYILYFFVAISFNFLDDDSFLIS